MAPREKQQQPPGMDQDFSLKQTFPNIAPSNRPVASAFDMVEPMHYLYIRVVKAKDLFDESNDHPSYDPYVEVRVGHYKASTSVEEKKPNPGWNQVFAFSKDKIYSPFVEILLLKKDSEQIEVKGRVVLDVNETPKRVPPDSPLAPQWFKLERGELMLAVWMGTQADEAFAEAWLSDAAGVNGEGIVNTKSKVYLSPKLWYLRVNVIQAQNLEVRDRNRSRPEVFVRCVLGTLMLRTRVSVSRNLKNPEWNEDLMLVAAEPFENPLVLTVEDKVGNNKEEVIGKCEIHVGKFEIRLVDKQLDARWYDLERPGEGDDQSGNNERRFKSRIQLRACLDGGYHVFDETTHCSSDFRPTVRQLWKQGVGVLELGILNATGLPPMKKRHGQGRTDAYCVAKYGQKWIRTRTIVDSSSPQWNEQYTWEVYDPCTVVTVGVFDNSHLQSSGEGGSARDLNIGKIRIRLSTLQTGRIYTHSYPLFVLNRQGLQKMGELQLAMRFSCSSYFNLFQIYTQPILPRMHYTHPIPVHQQGHLRHQATQLLSLSLGRSEPPLRREVVEYMLDYGSHFFSMRRYSANLRRIQLVCSIIYLLIRLVKITRSWKKPFLTTMVHLLLLFLVLFPKLICSSLCLCLFLFGLWNLRSRPRDPSHMDPQLSCISNRPPQEDLDEEFDEIPTTCKNIEALKFRYNRLRVAAGKLQCLLGDLATFLERLQSLLNWRDPRATAMFLAVCLVAGIILFVVPFRMMVVAFIFYTLRHPRFRTKLPSAPSNFVRRLPAKTDSLL